MNGRWLSTDPARSRIFDPQRINKFSYGLNDPVNGVDPDGREPLEVCRIVGYIERPNASAIAVTACDFSFIGPPGPMRGDPTGVSPTFEQENLDQQEYDQRTAVVGKAANIIRDNKKCNDFFGGDAAADALDSFRYSKGFSFYHTPLTFATDGNGNVTGVGYSVAVTLADGNIGLNVEVFYDAENIQIPVGNGRTITLLEAFNLGRANPFSLEQFQQIFTLHEWAHARHIPGFENDDTDHDPTGEISQKNTQKIIDNCFN